MAFETVVATFVGFNGSGKTTLLYEILGIPKPVDYMPEVLDSGIRT